MNPRSRAFVARHSPGEHILEGGAAKCAVLDRRHLEQLEADLGGTAAVRRYARSVGAKVVNFMEADWVATDGALYYVTFYPSIGTRWAWSELTDAAEGGGRHGLMTRVVRITTYDKNSYDFVVGRASSKQLLYVAASLLTRS